MRKIILPQPVRLFNRATPTSALLVKSGLFADKGTEVEVGPVEIKTYDHRDQAMVSFKCPVCPRTHYMIAEEIGLSLSS